MKHSRLRIATAITGAVLLLSGCSGDGKLTEEQRKEAQQYVDSFATGSEAEGIGSAGSWTDSAGKVDDEIAITPAQPVDMTTISAVCYGENTMTLEVRVEAESSATSREFAVECGKGEQEFDFSVTGVTRVAFNGKYTGFETAWFATAK